MTKHTPKCLAVLDKTILVNPKLEVFPCCSQVIENTLLMMGNLREESLLSIINSIEYNKVLHVLFTEGFAPFLEFLEKLGVEYPKKLTSACELCEYLFKDDWFLRLLKEEEYFDNL